MEETVRAFNHVINQGKALYWGTSDWNADENAQAWRYADKLGLIGPRHGTAEDSILKREKVEHKLAHLYREVGLGLTTCSPLRLGILSGKHRDGIPEGSRLAQTQVEFIAGLWQRTGKDEFEAMAAGL
ncbi:MAG: hypothetical protein STHCBS139747_007465 [Sporothrix thermara]